MRRELGIAIGARVTWFVAALSALLVGHGFVLALDVYSASSRSALASTLQAREMDPLAGIVRPTLGAAELAVALLVPLVACRGLAIEKERGTWGALCLLEGSSGRVLVKKLAAAFVAASLVPVAPAAVFVAYGLAGGHLDVLETAWATAGEVLHVGLVAALSVAAAAWTGTLAHAVALGIGVSVASWAVDAAEGFAALAWLGGASAWSIERQLAPFQRGIASLGALAWLAAATSGASVLAFVGCRFDLRRGLRMALAGAGLILVMLLLAFTARVRRGYDWSEQRRASLPPAVVSGLRALSGTLGLDVHLDRDDSRRRQLERDVVSKLHLARPDLVLRTPLDEEPAAGTSAHRVAYGKVVVRAGASSRETRSTSRREIVMLFFDAANVPVPGMDQPVYAGYPFVAEGNRRTVLMLVAYVFVPAGLLAIGGAVTRRRSVR